jgi:hypothetical protein
MPRASLSLGGGVQPRKEKKRIFLPIFLHKKIIFLNFFNRKDEKGMVKDKISRYLALFWCFDNFFFVILFYTVFKQQDLFELYFIYKNSNLVLVKKYLPSLTEDLPLRTPPFIPFKGWPKFQLWASFFPALSFCLACPTWVRPTFSPPLCLAGNPSCLPACSTWTHSHSLFLSLCLACPTWVQPTFSSTAWSAIPFGPAFTLTIYYKREQNSLKNSVFL